MKLLELSPFWRVIMVVVGTIAIAAVLHGRGVEGKLAPTKRTVHIIQLDEGYTVRCEEEHNPYAFREVAALVVEDVLTNVHDCLTMKIRRDWGK
jgi:hypothetical protein